jgi:hypothetical protein
MRVKGASIRIDEYDDDMMATGWPGDKGLHRKLPSPPGLLTGNDLVVPARVTGL